MGNNVLASNVDYQNNVEVLIKNKIVTDQVKDTASGLFEKIFVIYIQDNGIFSISGVTYDKNDDILIQFQTPQTMDSIVILPDSNVKTYSVEYKSVQDDQGYVLQEVSDQIAFA